MHDDNKDEHSVTELRLLRLVETAPGTYRASERIDWIHDPAWWSSGATERTAAGSAAIADTLDR
jgi:hypothetical protein